MPTAKNERSESTAVSSSRYAGSASSPSAHATTKPIETARSFVPSTRRTSGRAINSRSTKRPIAIIVVRKTAQRAISKGVVVAVSEMRGTGNCGAGPGFGPTANVNAPCTGCPSIEIARQ